MSFVYWLFLENDKYYVGRTGDIYRRIGQHFLGEGAKWTKLHKPKSVLGYVREINDSHEDYMTLSVMRKYGVDNVRGGRWCMQFFTNAKKAQLASYISYIDNKLSIEDSMNRIWKSRIDYISVAPSLSGIDKAKFGNDPNLWQELIEMKKCVICRMEHEVRIDKPYCYGCWKNEFIRVTGKPPVERKF